MDLAGACVAEARLDEARAHVGRAIALGHPMPGIGEALLARAAQLEGDVAAARAHLARAARDYPHENVMRSALAFDAWEANGCEGPMPAVDVAFTWDLACELVQPTNPGPIDRAALPFGPRRPMSRRRPGVSLPLV
jgi:hypothetical protein